MELWVRKIAIIAKMEINIFSFRLGGFGLGLIYLHFSNTIGDKFKSGMEYNYRDYS